MGQLLDATNLVLEISLAGLVILAFVILKNSQRKYSEIIFLCLIAAAFVWVSANLITNIYSALGDTDNVLIWTRLTILGPAFIPSLLILFANTFPENSLTLKKYTLGLLIFAVTPFLVFLNTDFNASSIKIVDSISSFTPGLLYLYLVVLFAISVIAITIIFWKKYKKSQTTEKSQIKVTAIGVTLTVIFGVVANVILPTFGYDIFATIGSASILAFIIATAYAILRYRLLDIKLIVAEIAVYTAIVIIAVELFLSKTTTEIIFRILLIMATVYGGRLLIRSMELEINRRKQIEGLVQEKTKALDELEQRNKNLATLQQISDIVLNENDTKAMTQKILDELPKQLESCIGGLLSIAKDGKLTAYGITQNNLTKRVIAMIGGSLEKYSFPIKKEYNKIHEALVDKKSIDSDSLADFISPPIPKAVALSIQKITGAKHVEVFPLYAAGEPLGVMLFVFSRPGSEVHEKNYAIAKAISDDLSLAVQRAQAFDQLKAANEYLSQLDKMKDEFISMASHELNTPLAAIEGYLSMILDEHMGKIDKQSRMYLTRAYASSKRLAELILDLLNVSRIEQGRLKVKYDQVSMGEMIQSVVHELQIKADSKKIYLKIEAAKDLPKIWCDPDRIREVIVNLTGNAIKFTEKGGITIKASQPDPKNLRVDVIDTGRGIAKEDQSKLFQKFSQVKREVDEHQGTGLGLYISKNFVELHKGKLWVESAAGKGATFSFELPLISKPPKEVEGAILEKPIGATRIETATKGEVPKIITDSSRQVN